MDSPFAMQKLIFGNVVIVDICPCEIFVKIIVYAYSIPIFLITRIIYISKRFAPSECSKTNICYTLGNYYTCKR